MKFVPDADVSAYFQLADIALASYQHHVSISGILLQAATTGKPVLSSNYGLMEELVNRYQLGLVIDSTQPTAITQGLEAVTSTSLDSLGSRTQMKSVAEQNSATQFAQVIFDSILSTKHSS